METVQANFSHVAGEVWCQEEVSINWESSLGWGTWTLDDTQMAIKLVSITSGDKKSAGRAFAKVVRFL